MTARGRSRLDGRGSQHKYLLLFVVVARGLYVRPASQPGNFLFVPIGVRLLVGVAFLTLSMAGCAAGTTPTSSSATSTSAPRSLFPTQQPSTSATTDEFRLKVTPIDDSTAARMTSSWRPGCPIRLDELQLVTVSHWGFDGRVRQGELVVGTTHAAAVASVFRELFEARFPIESMRLVDEFDGDDDRSMAANNTSAFNCRFATGSQRWSEHAYGRAIDINPIQNPYVTRGGAILPPAGAAHTQRDPATPGLITEEGPVTAAFRAIGWSWGGNWSSGKDYQHFSASGR